MVHFQGWSQRAHEPKKAALEMTLGSVIPSPPLVMGRRSCSGISDGPQSSSGLKFTPLVCDQASKRMLLANFVASAVVEGGQERRT